MVKQEQAVADIFNDYMRERCDEVGANFHSFSLGGQDRDSADYLISNATGFALIEFKHSEAELSKEGLKSRREQLCRLLHSNGKMRRIHDKCHFVAWMDQETKRLRCAPYRTEICNKATFPNCSILKRSNPLKSKRVLAETYCDEFFSPPPPRYADKEEFERYLAWLMKEASSSSKATVELMARSPGACTAMQFESVDAAYKWMQSKPAFDFARRKLARR